MAVTNSTLLVGDSGTGMSSLLATLAEWVWKKHKKVSLLYCSDGGGFPTRMDALIRAGIVRAWKLRTRGEAFETCSRACQGYWPVEFINPEAGETPPGVQLVPSTIVTFTMRCSACKAIVSTQKHRRGFQARYACKCGATVSLQQGSTIEESTELAPFFKDVGAVLNDGLTSMNDWIMEDMADKTGRGELRGETAAIGGRIVSGDMTFGGANRSHYGYAQTRSLVWLQDANNIQGLVVGAVLTSRVQRGTERDSNTKIYGPQIAGQAKTADLPAYVGNCLGCTVLVDDKGRKEWRMYLTEYRDANDDAIHLCKTRGAPGTMPEYLSDGPIDSATGKLVSGAPSFTQFNLGLFMELLENSTKKTFEETLAAFPDAPGHDYLKTMKEQVVEEPVVAAPAVKAGPPLQLAPKPTVPSSPSPKPGPSPNAPVVGAVRQGPRPVLRPGAPQTGGNTDQK